MADAVVQTPFAGSAPPQVNMTVVQPAMILAPRSQEPSLGILAVVSIIIIPPPSSKPFDALSS
ncbi:hypothetical protein AN958_11504 [Leucoagaricus sp. SymC.cos]|nr:hypothetical protein AN958_11504 [Leucoagaricus sp. SymC.cos]